uniref:PH domain-containing protein n=1 Tax=Strigamia maritima TaxID=126957 RepID=T1JKC9_STRMM
MKVNDKELATIAGSPADKEGRLNHKGNSHRDVYREKWFKLKGNLLFYYRLNEYGAVTNQEKPDGVFVIEQCKVQMEPKADSPFVFQLVIRIKTFLFRPNRKTLQNDPLQKFGVQVQFHSSALKPPRSSIPRNNSAPSTVWLLDLNS